MIRLRNLFPLLLAPVLLSAKNFGPDITPFEFFLSLLLLIIIAILFFGGPFGTYYWMTSSSVWLKVVTILSVLLNLGIFILCLSIPMDIVYIILLSIWNLLTFFSFILAVRKVILSNGKRH